ncbi:hypothetical protein JZ751_013384 [Albula glossodonta]|uniref:Uncharacterized protein n=1 Tax=Albula glossodonta TaxID=121402 RepID=A0A8T2MPV5_9TELE|nr:hypothetical protein JZ751_027124 [Albula glossodonta]KAG9333177.1 hypothetical protein JZ751_013384 [Albula glossodonta]
MRVGGGRRGGGVGVWGGSSVCGFRVDNQANAHKQALGSMKAAQSFTAGRCRAERIAQEGMADRRF